VAGTIISVNTALESAPETVNSAPYEGGWMLKVKLADPAATSSMLDADAYRNLLS
jgi:glycine cleavage system H protein